MGPIAGLRENQTRILTGRSIPIACSVIPTASSPSPSPRTATRSRSSWATRSAASAVTVPASSTQRRQEATGGRDLTIVNPRHLDPILRGNVCEQCHLVGDRRVNRLGRDAFDYRPGLPLTEFFVDYGHTTDEGQKLVGQVEQMKASRCFRASQGRLGCVSCHDPHEVPEPDEKIAYFRERCLACHERSRLQAPRAGSPGQKPRGLLHRMPHADVADGGCRAHRSERSSDPEGPACLRRQRRSGASSLFPLVRLNGDVDRSTSKCSIESWRSPWWPRGRGCPTRRNCARIGPARRRRFGQSRRRPSRDDLMPCA